MAHPPIASSSTHLLTPGDAPPVQAGRMAGIVVGIDPGLDQHGVVALATPSCYRLKRHTIPNSLAGMDFLVQELIDWRAQSGGQLTIGIEEASAYGEALELYLEQAGFKVVVVSELKVARFKDAIALDANDEIDAEAVARLLMVQPDLCRAPLRSAIQAHPSGSTHRRLRQLSRRHQDRTVDQTRTCNSLHSVLRMAWLADYQQFFSEVNGAAALALWQAYPTPAEAAQADPEALATLLNTASHRRLKKSAALSLADKIIGTARLMVAAFGRKDPQRWTGWAEDIRLLARHLVNLAEQLKVIDRQMEVLLETIDTPLTSFKGLGTVTAAVLHGEALSFERFPSADHFARYNGTAPREDSSGRSKRHVKNRRCNRRLRCALLQLALQAPRYHPESKAYMDQLKLRGITGGAARLRLARRLSDIVFAMARNNKKYDLEYFRQRRSRKPAA